MLKWMAFVPERALLMSPAKKEIWGNFSGSRGIAVEKHLLFFWKGDEVMMIWML